MGDRAACPRMTPRDKHKASAACEAWRVLADRHGSGRTASEMLPRKCHPEVYSPKDLESRSAPVSRDPSRSTAQDDSSLHSSKVPRRRVATRNALARYTQSQST